MRPLCYLGLPNNAYCSSVAERADASVIFEREVLRLVNEVRAIGHICASGYKGPANPLTLDATLTCAARAHSQDMADSGFFNHTNLAGEGPGQRIRNANGQFRAWGENIAAGYNTPEWVVQGWLASPYGHCDAIMNPHYTYLGVGYAADPNSPYRHYWTQNFGGSS